MTLRQAASLFFKFPSPRLIALLIAVSLAVRIALGAFGPADAAILAVIPVYWAFQEWVLHRFVLHLEPFRVGRFRVDPIFARTHRSHHAKPWSLPEIFLPARVVAVAFAINCMAWWLIAPTLPLAATGVFGISAMALVYEWIHYLTHTAYRPRTQYYSRICLSHRRHHFKNEHYWYGFVIPGVDWLLGTGPDHKTVETSPTCRTLGISAEAPPDEKIISFREAP